MDDADLALVFYSKHALEIKKLAELPREAVAKGFDKKGLVIINERQLLETWLEEQEYKNAVVVFMSSGNYDGFDNVSFARNVIRKENHYPQT